MKQQSSRPSKNGSIERVVNRNLIFLVLLLFLNCTVGAIGDAVFVTEWRSEAWYAQVSPGLA